VARAGKPADLIVEEARKANARFIITGSHGRTGLKRAVLGSVAEAVLRLADRPVLVVPSKL
jgi:nucleotide-binding universal stress UspA family protein